VDADARIEALEEENELLRERIAYLERANGRELLLPLELGLTKHEGRVVAMLYQRAEVCSKEQLMHGCYADRHDDEPEIKIIDVFICKARKKIAPFGLKIETIWGRGYSMGPDSRALLRQMLGDAEASAA
jgi:two-component system cell cycle response regulator CtrA